MKRAVKASWFERDFADKEKLLLGCGGLWRCAQQECRRVRSKSSDATILGIVLDGRGDRLGAGGRDLGCPRTLGARRSRSWSGASRTGVFHDLSGRRFRRFGVLGAWCAFRRSAGTLGAPVPAAA